MHAWTLYAREPGDLHDLCRGDTPAERSGKACGHKPDMNAVEKSDTGVVPKKEPNKVGSPPTAEALEERPVTEGNFCKARMRLACRGRSKH